MKQIKIPKARGEYRIVYSPSKRERRALLAVLPELNAIAERVDVHGVAHAFRRGRNCVTNAIVHRGRAYTLTMDLRGWFDSVRRDQLASLVPAHILDIILVDGAPRQGLPTSPAACNIAAAEMDRQIVAALAGRGVYTRYADDLAVSADDLTVIHEMRAKIEQIVAGMGWQIHPGKTHLQAAGAGRRNITGIAVDDTVHATRKTRRAVRAAEHRARRGGVLAARRAAGLREWAACRLPAGCRRAFVSTPSSNQNQTSEPTTTATGVRRRIMIGGQHGQTP